MADIFDNEILCRKCRKIMKLELVSRNGFNLRTLKCAKCNEIIVHPVDKAEYENFMKLKQKEFEVKMRMVGNSYAVSIPREIVDFMNEQASKMNNMVKLCFEDMGKLSLDFNMPKMAENAENRQGNPNMRSRAISAKEVTVVRNGKPVLHTKEFYDSAHPERSRKIVRINNKNEKEAEEEIEQNE